ncbi:hypothetical protein E4U47_003553 [Claviceps purpurea]|nr:hypothetical protein E4U27_007717 [Claviceps purpurea]KAG6169302.1 hypothetical protein E4U51_001651 [Claviceps purpurea]KAG6261747.1 hypothetical protein E4U48_007569 [Claviceps purpurea]KAG6270457.1 hypothetical protein E4U47_003553 [Claviceps purpurea]
MQRQRFVPARNSRHRIAAISLYRALLRSADKVATPERSALRHAVRSRFVVDRPLTSLRLVYASMAAGYKFLSLLAKAQDQTSTEYAQVVSHLRRMPPPPNRTPLPPPPPPPKLPPKEPFLVDISKTDAPHYVPTYRLQSKVHNLNLCATSDGLPFLRLKKPQPPALSKMIGQKSIFYRETMIKWLETDEEPTWQATQEDEWEDLMAAQMRQEGLSGVEVRDAEASRLLTSSYRWSVKLTKLWWEWKLEKMWRDWVARGEALNKFFEEEKHPASVPEASSSSSSSPSSSSSSRGGDEKAALQADKMTLGPPPNVGVMPVSQFPFSEAIEAQLKRMGISPGQEPEVDPFIGPRWNALVECEIQKQQGRGSARGQAWRDAWDK